MTGRAPIFSTKAMTGALRAAANGALVRVFEIVIERRYAELAGVSTPDGYDLQAYLGAALGAETRQGGAVIQAGFIVLRGGHAYVVYGPVAAAWVRLGGPSGLLGLPTGDTEPATGSGATSSFDGGVIAWSPGTGAYELHGAILARWQQLGGPEFGYPTSDEQPLLVDGSEVGRTNSFPAGAGIYWSAATGAWELTGNIASLWRARNGAAGSLGLPTSGQFATPGGDGGTYSQFVGGVVVDHPDGPYNGTFAITSLTLQLTQFRSTFDDIHVECFVDVDDPSIHWHDWIPSESDYTSDPTPADTTPVHLPVVHADTTITVSFDGLGDHSFGADERLGFVKHTYDISNLWGTVGEVEDHPATDDINPDFTFGADYLFTTPALINPGRPFRENFMWPFSNFTTAELGQDDYAQTYSDIAYDESTAWHPFDDYFYSHVYQHCADSGNCYGMVLAALYAYAGRSVFTEPIYDNPSLAYSPNLAGGGAPNQNDASDERFARAVNIMHGYQFGQPAMDWYHGLSDSFRSDPKAVFDQSKALHDAGEQVLLAFGIFKGEPQHEGHAVLPWSWEWNGEDGRIYIANPNQPWSRSPQDSAAGNYVDIAPGPGGYYWQVTMGGAIWEGGPIDDTEIYHVPFRVLATRPPRESVNFIDAISNSATIVTGTGTDVTVTDSGSLVRSPLQNGFGGVYGLVEIPIVSTDQTPVRVSSERLPIGRVPVRPGPPLIHPGGHGRLFRLQRPLAVPRVAHASGPVQTAPILEHEPELSWTLTPAQGSTATSLAIRSGRGALVVEIDGTAGADTVTTGPTVGAVPSVSLTTSAASGRSARVQATGRADLPGVTVTTVEGLAVLPDVPAMVHLLDDGTGVAVLPATEGTCQITVSRGGDQLQHSGVPLSAGVLTVLAPVDPAAALAGQHLQMTQLAADGAVRHTQTL